ncbi:hypothetical protein Tcan_04131 [Toxocara canis]|uniref:Uncharacterized protein n=1 Tax=Toxocara canis TaxID=6265 RepID=A0A0B2VU40_TOXCA|nr:hypothetical protein Tcan_04131 [Toxocara canis]
MNALLLVSTLCVSLAVSQDCSTAKGAKEAFGKYLNCIKATLDQDYGVYEKEIREHNRKAASTCFASSIAEANSKERCVLALSDLEQKAWDRNGPLRDCSICRTFAAGAIKAILSTPAEEQRCIRAEVTKAVAREADYCLKKKIDNFAGVPEIPDLEEGSYEHKDNVISSVSDYILIHSRLSFCAERKPARATATKKCLKNPFPGFMEKHCKALHECDSAISGGCASVIKNTKRATCECVEGTRSELKKRISSIADAIKSAVDGNGRGTPAIGSGSKVDTCVANIKTHMVTPVNDWVAVIDSALGACIKNKPAGQNLGMDSLLNVGCRKVIADTTGTAATQLKAGFDFVNNLIDAMVIADTTGTAATQLKAGFDFVNNLIDAMVDRSGRFCGGPHCQE